MHIGRRSAAVLALATAGALAVAGIALATGSSTVPGFSFTPNNPHGVFKAGKLSVHTQTSYTNPGTNNPGNRTNRIQLNFDDDFQFNPDGLPKCAAANIQGKTMAQALAQCGPQAGTANNAWLWPSTATANGTAKITYGAFTANACVLAFNGQGVASEVLLFLRANVSPPFTINCSNPTSNTAGNVTWVLLGDLKPNPAISADYTDPDNCAAPGPRQGCQIDINNITSVLPTTTGPTDINLSLQRGNYIRARCVDPPAGNRKWNLRALVTYNGGSPSTTTVFKSQTCT